MELQKLIDGLKAHKSGAASYESVDEAIRVFEAMRDVDGEKVVKELEELRNFADTDVHPVVSPDNWDVYADLCDLIDGLRDDALDLIRQQQERIKELEAAQTARVMTLEEVSASEDPVYFEANALHQWAIRCCISGDVMFITWRNGSCACCRIDKYNKGWRCWTQRPTDEQRKAVPWNG